MTYQDRVANGALTDGAAPQGPAASDVAPSSQLPASGQSAGARHQPWCAADVPPGAGRCPRCGVWQPANFGALKTGLHTRRTIETADALAALAEQRQEIERDRGGSDALARVYRDLVGRYVETSALADTLGQQLVSMGIVTSKGRPRSILNAYLQVLDRQHRLALTLGLQRVARPVPTLAEYLAARAESDPADEGHGAAVHDRTEGA